MTEYIEVNAPTNIAVKVRRNEYKKKIENESKLKKLNIRFTYGSDSASSPEVAKKIRGPKVIIPRSSKIEEIEKTARIFAEVIFK